MTFEEWFKQLLEYAAQMGAEGAVDIYNPESYREYYDDGDSPEDAYHDDIGIVL
jgi:hypothetical protein